MNKSIFRNFNKLLCKSKNTFIHHSQHYFTTSNNTNKNTNYTNNNKNNIANISNITNISEQYWQQQPLTYDSMAGVSEINQLDIIHTIKTLNSIPNISKMESVLELGAGIGRITFQALYKFFTIIDIVERNPNFIAEVKLTELKQNPKKIRKFICSSLEQFDIDLNTNSASNNINTNIKYDLIFIQWVLEYLTDDDLLSLLSKLKTVLNKEGEIVIKENVNNNTIFINDEGSTIRTINKYNNIFVNSGYKVVYSEKVDYNREDLYDIYCWRIKLL